MYPLNMTLPAGGYAVANSEAEHKALTEAGYGPAYVSPDADAPTVESVRAQLDALDIAYDKSIKDVAKLQALLPAA